MLSEKLKTKIIKFGYKNNLSISGTINYVYQIIKPLLQSFQVIGWKTNIFEYEFSEAIENMHVYMNIEEYHNLKHIAGTLLAYSTAAVLRKMIEYFFDKIQSIGLEELIKEIDNLVNQKFKKIISSKRWKKPHMSYSKTDLYYKITFNTKFFPIEFEFLNYSI